MVTWGSSWPEKSTQKAEDPTRTSPSELQIEETVGFNDSEATDTNESPSLEISRDYGHIEHRNEYPVVPVKGDDETLDFSRIFATFSPSKDTNESRNVTD